MVELSRGRVRRAGKGSRAGLGRSLALAALLMAGGCPAALRAQEAPVPLSVYGRLPSLEIATISPSGEHIALLAEIDGARRILIMDGKQHLVATTPVGDLKVRWLEWAGDDDLLVSFSKTVSLDMTFTSDKAELGSVLVLPVNGGTPWGVFSGESSITGGVRGQYGLAQRDGQWLGYFGGVTMQRLSSTGDYSLPAGRILPDLYEVDLATHKQHRVSARPPSESIDRDWLIDGQGILAAMLDHDRVTGAWTLTGKDRTRLAGGSDIMGNVNLIGFTADGASVIYRVRDKDQPRDRWFSVPLAGGTPQPFMDDAKIDRAIYGPGRRMIGYLDDLATSSAHFFDPRHEKIYRASQKAFPDQRMVLADQSADFRRLVVRTEGGGDAQAWWLVDIATGAATSLGTSYTIPPAQVAPFRIVPYKAADGLAMEGMLTLPPGRAAKGLPAVILPHGGPTARDVPGFDWIAQAFASRGYAVFQPNFRGSTGYGLEFQLAGNGEWGRKMQTDVSDGLAELVRQGIVDPARVCIVGASYGGYAALAGVTLQQGLYRCAVSIAGVSDLAMLVNTEMTESGGDGLLRRALREELGKGRDLAAVSPVHFADKVAVPVLLIHGKDDTVVSPRQSQAMAGALRRAGKPVEFVTLPGEDHWLSTGAARQAMLEAAVGFVTKHNPP